MGKLVFMLKPLGDTAEAIKNTNPILAIILFVDCKRFTTQVSLYGHANYWF